MFAHCYANSITEKANSSQWKPSVGSANVQRSIEKKKQITMLKNKYHNLTI